MLAWLLGIEEDQSKVKKKKKSALPAATPTDQGPRKKALPEGLALRIEANPLPLPQNASEEQLAGEVSELMTRCDSLIAEPSFDLPMLPAVAVKLMELTQQANVAIRDVSNMVMRDPVLTAKFLRLANSAFYGARSKIVSVQQATTLLGLNKVRNLVMSIALNGTIFKDRRLTLNAKHLWEHSIGCAMCGSRLAQLLNESDATVFLTGLLHDVGKIPTMLIVQRAMKPSYQIRPTFVDALLEKHHIQAGVALLARWELPTAARLAITCHHAINSLQDARNQVQIRERDADAEAREELAKTLAMTVIIDRSVCALGWFDEPGSLQVIDLPLSNELGLNPDLAETFLRQIQQEKDVLISLPFA